MRNTTLKTALMLAVAGALAGCGMARHHGGPAAHAKLEPTRGNATAGMAMFQLQGDQVLLHVRVEGLKPGAEHGFHIHERGDCSSGDGMSAGGHFNPSAKPHGQHGGRRPPRRRPAVAARRRCRTRRRAAAVDGPDDRQRRDRHRRPRTDRARAAGRLQDAADRQRRGAAGLRRDPAPPGLSRRAALALSVAAARSPCLRAARRRAPYCLPVCWSISTACTEPMSPPPTRVAERRSCRRAWPAGSRGSSVHVAACAGHRDARRRRSPPASAILWSIRFIVTLSTELMIVAPPGEP